MINLTEKDKEIIRQIRYQKKSRSKYRQLLYKVS